MYHTGNGCGRRTLRATISPEGFLFGRMPDIPVVLVAPTRDRPGPPIDQRCPGRFDSHAKVAGGKQSSGRATETDWRLTGRLE